MTKKAGGGVWWKQSFALYGVNDKSVLIDNPPFFCLSNKSCSPLPAYCAVNGQHSLKKRDRCEKGMRLREEEEEKN